MSNLSLSALRVQLKASLRRWCKTDDWMDELRRVTDNSSGAESISRETLVFFCESIDRLNDGLGIAKVLADLFGDDNSDSLTDSIAGRIHEVFHLISDLADKLEWLFKGDIAVSHGEITARSWSEIVLMNCRNFAFLIENDLIVTREHVKSMSYDSIHVKVQLAIEFDQALYLWDRLHATKDNGQKSPKSVPPQPGGDDVRGGHSKVIAPAHRRNSEELFKSALRAHHKYELGGSVMNYVPISTRKIEELTDKAISDSTAGRLLKLHFGSIKKYKEACFDQTIGKKLVVLLGDALHAFGTHGQTTADGDDVSDY